MAGSVPIAKSLKDIYNDEAIQSQTKRWNNILTTFQTTYGQPAAFVSRSPGRVNIIGEHIDYSLYPVLPMAITSDALFAVTTLPSTSSTQPTFRIANTQSEKFASREFAIGDDIDIDSTVHEWTNYFKCGLKGALQLLRKKYGAEFKPKSMDVVMDGSVPAGGGLSSSAAFVSGSALAILYANGMTSISKMELTELAIVAEREVGVNSGGMDQSASVLSERGSALYVSFSPKLEARPVQFPKTNPELCFLIAQSFVKADKHVTGPVCYNLRVVECTLAANVLNKLCNSGELPSDSSPLGSSLRGFQQTYETEHGSSDLATCISLVEKHLKPEGYTRSEIADILGISTEELQKRFESKFPVRAEKFMLKQRALHVYSEALRVQKFINTLEHPPASSSSDGQTEEYNRALGALMNETQTSCRELYDCSCPELDELCTIARKAGAYGSRLTGAGWGGCSVHLVPADRVEDVKAAWEREFYDERALSAEEREGAVVVSRPGCGSAVFVVEGGVVR